MNLLKASLFLMLVSLGLVGCATYPNTYIQDSTITTNTQQPVEASPYYGGNYYPSTGGSFLQWLVFGPPGGGYYGGGGWGGYYGGGGWGGGCWPYRNVW